MSEWKAKRFWKEAEVMPQDDGFSVALDGRPVRTPAKRHLIVPTKEMAKAIAIEWDAQDGVIQPETMPVTKTANSAIDKVAVQHAEVAEMLAAYGDSDLLCYRAPAPEALVARQAEMWDPLLEWSAQTLGAPLQSHTGVMHVPQDSRSLEILRARTFALTAFELAAFHDLVSLSGSLVIGFAATHDFLPADALWRISRLDEIWEEEQWGEDDDATRMARIKETAFCHAKRMFDLAHSQ
ncbi:ATP12 family protein [uncultured Sulfitobacter sp.]|uniref:ATP12 family chaperone protein n=1 Tax=uncultured Sulfitobacter sp. TaxID=191468 RepID=UPI002634C3EE|nr:ATP12 family protein [uncultured Sulfitobacter sp.]